MSNKQYLHSQEIARKIDQAAINEYHISSLILMENAALRCSDIIIKKEKKARSFCILCNQGNNGADGMAIARILDHKGYKVLLYLPSQQTFSKEASVQFSIIQALDLEYTDDLQEVQKYLDKCDIIIDCLFGNGISRNIEGICKQLINMANNSHKKIYSIDMPSGIHATSGKIMGCAIKADTTISLDCFKQGQWIYPGKEHCGKLLLADIGIPEELHIQEEHAIKITKQLVKELFPKRNDHSHKGNFGKALMIGGSKSMPGALAMAAKACAASGIGTLTLMEPECIGDLMALKMDFAMHLQAKEEHGYFSMDAIDLLKKNMDRYDLISIGNGIGKNEVTKQMVKIVLSSKVPVILDADALWAIKEETNLLNRDAQTILTPHIKEMTNLIDRSSEQILADPFSSIKEFIKNYPNCVLVLKSDITYIGHKQEIYVLSKPNSALAKGGSGDLLCGIITGLLGHKIPALNACICACYAHAKSAQINKDPASINAEDIIKELSFVYRDLRKD